MDVGKTWHKVNQRRRKYNFLASPVSIWSLAAVGVLVGDPPASFGLCTWQTIYERIMYRYFWKFIRHFSNLFVSVRGENKFKMSDLFDSKIHRNWLRMNISILHRIAKILILTEIGEGEEAPLKLYKSQRTENRCRPDFKASMRNWSKLTSTFSSHNSFITLIWIWTSSERTQTRALDFNISEKVMSRATWVQWLHRIALRRNEHKIFT